MRIQDALQQAKEKMRSVTDQPMFEAELLLAHVLKKPRPYLYAWPEQVLSEAALTQFLRLLQRRYEKEPIAYIMGTKEFWSLPLTITPATLIPRPETEVLVESVLKAYPRDRHLKIADLGTGSGAIALALASERPHWDIHAVDSSEQALEVARKNAQQLQLHQVSFHHGNWCTALLSTDFDAIVSNPPYIAEMEWAQYAEGLAFEPRQALVSGKDGLEAIRTIIQTAKHCLKP